GQAYFQLRRSYEPNMFLIILIDILIVGGIAFIASTKDVERALPFFTFVVVLAPLDANIPLGLFDLTPQRIALVTLTVIYVLSGVRQGDSLAEYLKTPLMYLIGMHVCWSFISTLNSV